MVMDKTALNNILKKHNEEIFDLSKINPNRINLSGINLSRADLSEANLYRINLSEANLYRANLNEANLCRAEFYGANLHLTNLSGADLRGAKLNGANLYGANLSGADLRGANFNCANLYGVNFSGANLSRANLSGANLGGVNFYGANLYRANIYGADLSGADLYGALNIPNDICPIRCPQEGSFIGFKKAFVTVKTSELYQNVIVKLRITDDAKRSSATTRKCRCDKAEVISITSIDGNTEFKEAHSNFDRTFKYKTGEIVSVDNFDDDRWNECSAGIHFFVTREEAVNY